MLSGGRSVLQVGGSFRGGERVGTLYEEEDD
jgi:hypothetical protein